DPEWAARAHSGHLAARSLDAIPQQPPSTTAPVARLRMLMQPALPVTKLSNRLASLLTFEPGDRDLRCPSDARQNHLQKLSDPGDACGDSFFSPTPTAPTSRTPAPAGPGGCGGASRGTW